MKKILSAIKKFKGTILLSLLLIFSFFYLSKGKIFIPVEVLYVNSFSLDSINNFISYMLIHASLLHVTVNLVSLAAFSFLVEWKLSSKDAVAVFFFSGIAAAFLFSLLNPDTQLMGASAGVSGLIAASFLLNPKRSLIAVLLVVFLLSLFLIPTEQKTLTSYPKHIEQKTAKITQDLNKAVQAGDMNKVIDLNRQFTEVKKEETEFKKAEELRIEIKTDPMIHGYGAIFGIIYLLAVRRKEFRESMKEYLGKK